MTEDDVQIGYTDEGKTYLLEKYRWASLKDLDEAASYANKTIFLSLTDYDEFQKDFKNNWRREATEEEINNIEGEYGFERLVEAFLSARSIFYKI